MCFLGPCRGNDIFWKIETYMGVSIVVNTLMYTSAKHKHSIFHTSRTLRLSDACRGYQKTIFSHADSQKYSIEIMCCEHNTNCCP